MNILISILGLGFLILIHEAGHFFVARAVGMNPRKFYLGFPPALVKTKRNGIEYGVGAIPLGGYVKIPGMHRPAAGDLDMHFGRAVEEDPSLRRPVEELRGRLEENDYVCAREAVAHLAAQLDEARLSPVALKTAQRGLAEVDDALAPDAYWRARTWKRVAVIFAGPAANLVLAVAIFAALFMVPERQLPPRLRAARDDRQRHGDDQQGARRHARPRKRASGRATESSRSTGSPWTATRSGRRSRRPKAGRSA